MRHRGHGAEELDAVEGVADKQEENGQSAEPQAGRVEEAVLNQVPGAADVAGRLEDDLSPNRGAEAALAAELVQRDAALVNPEMVEYVQNFADAEAQ